MKTFKQFLLEAKKLKEDSDSSDTTDTDEIETDYVTPIADEHNAEPYNQPVVVIQDVKVMKSFRDFCKELNRK